MAGGRLATGQIEIAERKALADFVGHHLLAAPLLDRGTRRELVATCSERRALGNKPPH